MYYGVLTLFLKGLFIMINSGVFSQIFEEAGFTEGDLMVFAGIMIVYFAFLGIILLAMYLLEAVGLYGMAKRSGISRPWRGFVPFANTFLFGKIAEKYRRRDGKRSAKFSVLLLARLSTTQESILNTYLIIIRNKSRAGACSRRYFELKG